VIAAGRDWWNVRDWDYISGLTASVLPVSPTGSQTGKRGRDCLPIKQFGPVTRR